MILKNPNWLKIRDLVVSSIFRPHFSFLLLFGVYTWYKFDRGLKIYLRNKVLQGQVELYFSTAKNGISYE